jgi:translation initiation factor IF-3
VRGGIESPEVRLIAFDGHEIGIMPTEEARRMAKEQGLELVLLDPVANPPVCRLLDFARFKFEAVRKQKAWRRLISPIAVKEVKLTPTTDPHDLRLKLDQIRRFLKQRSKCMISVVFEGRESLHPETGRAMLEQVARTVGDMAMVEKTGQREDGTMVMLLAPRALPA